MSRNPDLVDAPMTVIPVKIWICDLTYTQQTIASDIMPAAVGCVATYAEKVLGDAIETRIFKFPETLIAALETEEAPRAIGFSNYAWNEDLSAEFARVIKRHRPDVVTIFGGPNYPTTAAEQADFLRKYPQIDFYVVKEGEIGFVELVRALIEVDFDRARVRDDVPSVHRIAADGTFKASPTVQRIRDLSEIPSPYLAGRMDEFFDGVMLPIVQTNRGCPFQCTFCVEGTDYYNKVAKTQAQEKIERELEYIAERMARLRDERNGRSDLHIADSNFGMFKEDVEIARSIAELQRRYRYPEYIMVATGKNNKDRVLEVARTVNGAIRLSGTVQSMDEVVLKNIKRANISVPQIMDLALSASEIGANSYSEIILGLPGDTLERHLASIKTIVEADFNIVCLYQLMLLPGTDLASEESVERWGMMTRYRAIPRCYGHFELFGEQIVACEIERICVSNESLTFAQYLECRRMHLIVNLFYNDGIFKEVLRLLKSCGVRVYDWLERIYEDRSNPALNALFADFLEETRRELWDDRDAFRAFTRDKLNIDRFISGEFGSNLIFKYRSRALLENIGDLAVVAARALEATLAAAGVAAASRLGRELIVFAEARAAGIFDNRDVAIERVFEFDVPAYIADKTPGQVESYRRPAPVLLRFEHTPEQLGIIRSYLGVYGTSLAGLSRILAKIYIRRLFRGANEVAGASPAAAAGDDLRFGQAALTGLNQFG